MLMIRVDCEMLIISAWVKYYIYIFVNMDFDCDAKIATI